MPEETIEAADAAQETPAPPAVDWQATSRPPRSPASGRSAARPTPTRPGRTTRSRSSRQARRRTGLQLHRTFPTSSLIDGSIRKKAALVPSHAPFRGIVGSLVMLLCMVFMYR